jgi:alpha-beta hydrolase superfamily lysophospholipase
MALSYPERFSSLVCMSTPLDLLNDLDKLAPVFAREHMVSTFAARTALYELAMHTQIEEGIPYTQSPLLVIGGGKDRIATADNTRTIFEQSLSTDKKLILCPAAGHCLYEMMPSLRYEIAQWIKQRLQVFTNCH